MFEYGIYSNKREPRLSAALMKNICHTWEKKVNKPRPRIDAAALIQSKSKDVYSVTLMQKVIIL